MALLSPPHTRLTRFALVTAAAALAAALAAPVHARVTQSPEVHIGSEPMMSIDGRLVGVTVLAKCPARWSVLEARLTATQGGVTGTGTFPLTCDSGFKSFRVTLPASGGDFQLASVRLDAVIRIARGKADEARASEVAALIPEIVMDAASTARLDAGGQAVLIDVTTGCPAGVTGLESYATVEQGGRSIGQSFFTPFCDGLTHTITLRIETRTNPYQPGPASVTAFAFAEFRDRFFAGVDSAAIQIVSP